MSRTAILRLALGQFRSHAQAEVETEARSVALFGPNGAGKTNVLEAVSMLSPGRGLRRATVDDMARRPQAVGWRVAADLESGGQSHEIDTRAEGGPRTVTIDGKTAPQVALGRLLRIVWLTPAMDRLWTEAAEGRRRFLDRVAMSFEPSHAETVLTYEKAMRERNRLLKDQVADPAWYRALESQMAEAGSRMHANREEAVMLLVSAQDEAETAFPAADLALQHAEEDLPGDAETLLDMIAASRPRDLGAGRSLVGPHRADLDATYRAKSMAARDCSTGEQKALLISLVLANARALARDFRAPPVLLLDEVAAHLDAERRQALYAEISALGCQAWMTGTGPELFDGLDDALRISVSETDGISELDIA